MNPQSKQQTPAGAETAFKSTLSHPRIGYHGGTAAEINSGIFFIAHDRSLAEEYASDTAGGRVVKVEDRSVNPLVLDTPEKFIDAWRKSGADKVEGNFHPNQTRVFGDWARHSGYDAIVIPESAFEGELGYEEVGGTVGEPQTIILDPKVANIVSGRQNNKGRA